MEFDPGKDVATLERLLRRHVELHRALLACAERQSEAIVANDTEALAAILDEEERLLKEVREVEERRVLVVERMAPGESLRLGEVIDRLEPAEAEAVARLREDLTGVLGRLRFQAGQNRDLLEASLGHIQAFFRMIAAAATPRPAYGRRGKKTAGALRLLDQRA